MKKLKNKIHVRIFVLLCFVTAIALSMILLQQTIETKKEPYRLIFISKTIDSHNDFWTSLIDGAELAAEELDVEIEVVGGSAEEDVEMNILERTFSVISVDDFTGILSRQNIIALVLFVIFSSIKSGLILNSSRIGSTKTGVAPTYVTAKAVAI